MSLSGRLQRRSWHVWLQQSGCLSDGGGCRQVSGSSPGPSWAAGSSPVCVVVLGEGSCWASMSVPTAFCSLPWSPRPQTPEHHDLGSNRTATCLSLLETSRVWSACTSANLLELGLACPEPPQGSSTGPRGVCREAGGRVLPELCSGSLLGGGEGGEQLSPPLSAVQPGLTPVTDPGQGNPSSPQGRCRLPGRQH